MKVGVNAQLAVKWASGKWSYYKVAPYRSKESLVNYFVVVPHFRFAILYQYDRESRSRIKQIGYFDKHKKSL
jgi:hypothetical protein